MTKNSSWRCLWIKAAEVCVVLRNLSLSPQKLVSLTWDGLQSSFVCCNGTEIWLQWLLCCTTQHCWVAQALMTCRQIPVQPNAARQSRETLLSLKSREKFHESVLRSFITLELLRSGKASFFKMNRVSTHSSWHTLWQFPDLRIWAITFSMSVLLLNTCKCCLATGLTNIVFTL